MIDVDDDVAIERRVLDRRAAAHRDAIARSSVEDLALLVFPPLLTVQVLDGVDGGGAAFVDRVRPLLAGRPTEADDVLVVAEGAQTLIDERLPSDHEALLELIQQVAARLATAEVPPRLRWWISMASGLGRIEQVAADVVREVRTVCDRGRSGEVIDLVEAARALGDVCGEPIAGAARIAGYRLAREYRLTPDRATLDAVVPRPAAEIAIDALWANDAPWALHLVGVGGAGKTNIIRRLVHHIAPSRGLTVARVDFDYLSPHYPGRDPGQLIEALVHEFAVTIDSARQDRIYGQIGNQLTKLRQVVRIATPTDPIGPMAWDEYRELLAVFTDFVRSLPRPVIVLDTCEELTKLDPVAGGRIPSLEATFYLLEHLHREVTGLRVVFAGRRLLCKGGAGWDAIGTPSWAPLSERRAYLAVHEVRGFDPAEADELLAKVIPAQRANRDELVTAIKDRCREGHRVEWLSTATDDATPRYAPFDLKTYADWVRIDPSVDAETLVRGDLDPYLEQRIVGRMGDLESLLPTVVALQRFDAATLAAVLDVDASAVASRFSALSGHEWLKFQDEPGRGGVLEVKVGLAARLELWLSRARRDAWERARTAVGAALNARVKSAGLINSGKDVTRGWLRCADDLAAAEVWSGLEAGVAADWAAVESLTRFILGDVEPDDPRLAIACVRATRCAAQIATDADVDVGPQWTQILMTAATHAAASPVAARLETRAALGEWSADCWSGRNDAHDVEYLGRLVDRAATQDWPALEGPVIAALEAAVERRERIDQLPEGWAVAVGDRLDRLPWSTSGVTGFGESLSERVLVLAGYSIRPDTDLVELVEPGEPPTLLDWRPPSSLADRLDLEWLRRHFWDGARLPERCERFAEDTPASNRDAYHLSLAVIARQQATHFERSDTWMPLRDPPTTRVPRVYEVFAWEDWYRAAVRDRPHLARAVDGRAQIRGAAAAARRYRDESLLAPVAARSSALDESVHDLSLARSVLRPVESPAAIGTPLRATSHPIHADRRLRTTVVRTADGLLLWSLSEWTTAALRSLPKERDSAALARAILEELAALSERTTHAFTYRPAYDLPDLATVHPDRVEFWARLMLRAHAAGEVRLGAKLDKFFAHTPRVLADLAFEEAQVIALRLPQRAEDLYRIASAYYRATDDVHGWIAAELGGVEVALLRGVAPPTGWKRPLVDAVARADAATASIATAWARKKLAAEHFDRFRTFASHLLAQLPSPPPTYPSPGGGPASGQTAALSGPYYPAPPPGHPPPGYPPYGGYSGEPRPIGIPPTLTQERTTFVRWWHVALVPLAGFFGLMILTPDCGKKKYEPTPGSDHSAKSIDWVPWFAIVIGLVGAGLALRWWWRRRGRSRTAWQTMLVIAPDSDGVMLTATLGGGWHEPRPERGSWPELWTDSPAPLSAIVTAAPSDQLCAVELLIAPELQPFAWERAIARSSYAARLLHLWRSIDQGAVREPRSGFQHIGASELAWPSARAQADSKPFAMTHAIGAPLRDATSILLDPRQGRRSTSVDPATLGSGDTCVVLQGLPGDHTTIDDAYRVEVGQLRELAVATIEAGAQVVLLLPPLPSDISRDLIARLAKVFTRARSAKARKRYPDERTAIRGAYVELAAAARTFLRDRPSSFDQDAADEVTLLVGQRR